MFAWFDEIPSLPVQDIKEKPKCRGLRITKGNNSKRIGPYPLFSIINVHLVEIICLPNFMKFRHCLFKILKNQNVTDRRMDGQRENSIPTPQQTQFAGGGYKKL